MLTRRQALTSAAAAFATALPLPLHAASDSNRPPSPDYTDGRIRLSCGRCLSYRDYGDNTGGPLIFYFHGTPGSRIELSIADQESYDSRARVVAIDRPGMGRSTYYSNRRITHWPSDVLELAAALGYGDQKFGVIGLSGGGPYAAVCAHQIPERLTHVAIVSGHAPLYACGTCPGNQDKKIELVRDLPRLGKKVVDLVDRRMDRKPDKAVKKISESWTASDRKLILCDQRRYCKLIENLREANRCGTHGLVKDITLLGSCWGFCLSEIIGVPVSIWQGGCDQIVTPSMARYFHKHIDGSELIIDPKAGHVTMFKWHVKEILSRFGITVPAPAIS